MAVYRLKDKPGCIPIEYQQMFILSPGLEMCQKNEGVVDPEPFEVYGVSGFKRGKVPRIARTNFKAQVSGM
jgi:hypothetical protein